MTSPARAPLDRRFAVAPMMDWTNRHCRLFHRHLTRRTLLYTEMITTGAILHGDAARHLAFDAREHPVALQLGGAEPEALARSAQAGAAAGYDEINLNCGCPSDRVQNGRFGACLMAEPALVADCVAAMRACGLPVTVKCRIGIDERDSYGELQGFAAAVAGAGAAALIVHARKAWLSGLSPKENREIPPLRYEVVHRLKADFPDLPVVINGGFLTLDQAFAQLGPVDGVMMGRAAYQDPWLLLAADRTMFGDAAASDDTSLRARTAAVAALLPLLAERRAAGVPLRAMTRHMLGLFNGLPGARRWRRILSEAPPDAPVDVVGAALAAVAPSERLAA